VCESVLIKSLLMIDLQGEQSRAYLLRSWVLVSREAVTLASLCFPRSKGQQNFLVPLFYICIALWFSMKVMYYFSDLLSSLHVNTSFASSVIHYANTRLKGALVFHFVMSDCQRDPRRRLSGD
jgi:hypothetical protein